MQLPTTQHLVSEVLRHTAVLMTRCVLIRYLLIVIRGLVRMSRCLTMIRGQTRYLSQHMWIQYLFHRL